MVEKQTVKPPPGHGHVPQIRNKEIKKKDVSDHLAEWSVCVFFLCITAIAVVGTYKLIEWMLS